MKNRIAVAIASLLFASLGTAAYAQAPQQSATPPSSATPTYNPDAMPANQGSTGSSMSGNSMSGNSMSSSSMSNGSMSDQQVQEKVKKELTAHGVTATNVDVSFSNGTATLTGSVFNKADIAKAKKAAMRVKGVKHVDTSGLHAGGHAAAASGQS